jgi:cytochrome c-type biogenesis protein CcmE
MDPSSTFSAATSKKRRAKFALGAAALIVALVALVGWAMSRPGSTAFYVTPSELVAMDQPPTNGYRVNGTVVPGSIERKGLETRFLVTDGSTEIPVQTRVPLPDTFKSKAEVVARGTFEGGEFTADEVLAKCPSKFKARQA